MGRAPTYYGQKHYDYYKLLFLKNSLSDVFTDDVDEAFDAASGILTSIYKDKTCLPAIVKMIFKRHKEGRFINNLVWAFFQCSDPGSLILIANYLNSKEPEEMELAKKLLNFIPEQKVLSDRVLESGYKKIQEWIKENTPFLYFTAESFHQTSNPKPFIVNYGAKYLCKAVSVNTGKMLKPLTKEEAELLDNFNQSDETSMELISKFSFKLNIKNKTLWNIWLQFPIEQQKKLAELEVNDD